MLLESHLNALTSYVLKLLGAARHSEHLHGIGASAIRTDTVHAAQ
jgi:hypothetical protein